MRAIPLIGLLGQIFDVSGQTIKNDNKTDFNMTQRPFKSGRPLPEFGPGFYNAIKTLLNECQMELMVIDSLSALSLTEMKKAGGCKTFETEALKIQYRQEGRYSEAFWERHADLSRYLYKLLKIQTAWYQEARQLPTTSLTVKQVAVRRQEAAWWVAVEADSWPKLERIKYDLSDLDPNNVEVSGGRENCAPDNLSDGLSQGIGVRRYL